MLKKYVDLINLAIVSTVLRMQIITIDRRIFCADIMAVEEFELLVIVLYQKLNQERCEILATGKKFNLLKLHNFYF